MNACVTLRNSVERKNRRAISRNYARRSRFSFLVRMCDGAWTLPSGARKRFRRPTTSAPSISSDQEVSASVNRFKVTRNRVSNKNAKTELQTGKPNDYKVWIRYSRDVSNDADIGDTGIVSSSYSRYQPRVNYMFPHRGIKIARSPRSSTSEYRHTVRVLHL